MKIDSVKHGKIWFIFSALLVGASLLFMLQSQIKLGSPLRLGLDFTGGTKLEYRFNKVEINSEEVQEILSSIGLSNSQVTITKEEYPLLIIRTAALNDGPTLDKINEKFKNKYGDFVVSAIDTVSPTIGPELLSSGLTALAFTVIAMIIYISTRFKRDYAICAITALFHDVIIVMGLFAYLGLTQGIEIDSLFITAILSTFGFSVHDTIVVFDRIRENQKLQSQKFSFFDLANLSVNQVWARSLNTSLTTLTTLAFLFFLGGASTRNFVAALFVGLFVGTYSSLFLASPLLVWLRSKK
jgi:preprotein translocase subunit SecF